MYHEISLFLIDSIGPIFKEAGVQLSACAGGEIPRVVVETNTSSHPYENVNTNNKSHILCGNSSGSPCGSVFSRERRKT